MALEIDESNPEIRYFDSSEAPEAGNWIAA
jgi:hypothetical protein